MCWSVENVYKLQILCKTGIRDWESKRHCGQRRIYPNQISYRIKNIYFYIEPVQAYMT